MTRQETISKYLLMNHCKEIVPSKSRKYRQFQTPKGKTYWIGRQGAVRVGKAISTSISLTWCMQYKKIAEKVS